MITNPALEQGQNKKRASNPAKRKTPKITETTFSKYADGQYVKLLTCLYTRLVKAEPKLFKAYVLSGKTEDAQAWLDSAHQARMVASALRQAEKAEFAEAAE